MNMSHRERILLFVLGIIIVGYLFYEFIYTPQMNEISKLEDEIASNEELVEIYQVSELSIPRLEEENKELETQIEKALEVYISNIEQEDIIIFLHEKLEDSIVSVETLTFTPFVSFEMEEGNYLPYDLAYVEIPFTGDYQEVLALVNEFWNFEQNVYVSSIQMGTAEIAGEVTGTFMLEFIRVNDELANKDSFVEWNFGELNDTENPFIITPKNYFFEPNYEFLK